ncbi:MAG: tetratricopeptide repeat protein, partial [Saprospiraceae bacterium]|nr:tetratricopeptide repeat protein [Saprospiraceae bacterium]
LLLLILVTGCQADRASDTPGDQMITRETVIAYALNGKPLYPVPETAASYRKKDSLLQVARRNFENDPAHLQNIIWYGRRLAYLTNYPQAMNIYTRGLHFFPDSPELYRHRGHRYISMRKFEEAISDLTKAAELVRGRPLQIEPDGLPNKLNIPLSSLQFNIWYHLALAYYLQGNYASAAIAYDSCMTYSINPDLLCATTDWYYMTAVRLGDTARARALLAPIHADMEIIENDGYHQRLLMYKGEILPDSLLDFDNITPENELQVVTQGYGVGNYLLSHGRVEEARTIFQAILKTNYWPAFGYIAAEADLHRGL